MKHVVQRVLADTIWILHFFVVVIVLFGWFMPSLWPLYMAVLFAVFLSNVFVGHCVLSKWEFVLRQSLGPTLDYDHEYTSYYTYNLTKGYLSKHFLRYAGLMFTSLSLIINIYFKFWFT